MQNPEKQKEPTGMTGRASEHCEQRPNLFSSSELFGDKSEMMICHNGEIYRIRITRNKKLIMNK